MASPVDYSNFLSMTPTESPGLLADSRRPADERANNGESRGQESARTPFDLKEFGLDPSAFDVGSGLQFTMPTFVSGGPGQPWSDGPAFVEASVSRTGGGGAKPPLTFENNSVPTSTAPPARGNYKPDPANPVYSLYGSSVVGVNPDLRPFPAQTNERSSTDAFPPETPSTPFDPASIGLPTNVGGNTNFPGLYSASGFDLMGVLARVAARPNPQLQIGPVDTSAAFVVVDARKYDFPIVFASASFTRLTGYENNEVIGKNCRFIQAPPGGAPVQQGSKRKYTDSNAVWHMKSHILAGKECQASVRPAARTSPVRADMLPSTTAGHQLQEERDPFHQPGHHHPDRLGLG